MDIFFQPTLAKKRRSVKNVKCRVIEAERDIDYDKLKESHVNVKRNEHMLNGRMVTTKALTIGAP